MSTLTPNILQLDSFLLLDKKESAKFQQKTMQGIVSQLGGKPRECDVQVEKKSLSKKRVHTTVSNTVNKSIKMAENGSVGLSSWKLLMTLTLSICRVRQKYVSN